MFGIFSNFFEDKADDLNDTNKSVSNVNFEKTDMQNAKNVQKFVITSDFNKCLFQLKKEILDNEPIAYLLLNQDDKYVVIIRSNYVRVFKQENNRFSNSLDFTFDNYVLKEYQMIDIDGIKLVIRVNYVKKGKGNYNLYLPKNVKMIRLPLYHLDRGNILNRIIVESRGYYVFTDKNRVYIKHINNIKREMKVICEKGFIGGIDERGMTVSVIKLIFLLGKVWILSEYPIQNYWWTYIGTPENIKKYNFSLLAETSVDGELTLEKFVEYVIKDNKLHNDWHNNDLYHNCHNDLH